jgi:23S rRNA (adenine2030-N6)-methyltransferase
MKYRHGCHAGNFADVHKHVALLALLRALQGKDKGFLYLDTHAGRGSYDLSSPTAEAAAGIERFLASSCEAPELREYAVLLGEFRSRAAHRHRYPGSPLIAALELRSQDRAVFIELQGAEAHALEESLAAFGAASAQLRIERGDGFERLKAFLPPAERRGLTLLDPPYEETRADFARLGAALAEALRRFPTGMVVAWYPIKDQRTTNAWLNGSLPPLAAPLLQSELWLYPRDARVGLNGSGLLIANPPWRFLERMQVWLPQLQACLAAAPGGAAHVRAAPGNAAHGGGSSARMLSQSAQ